VKGDDAFSIEYTPRDPQKAMAVTDRLATLFIEETTRSRERQVEGAYEFIESQLHDARQQLETKDGAVRRYKESHLGTLPEQMGANLATLQRLQLEHQQINESIRANMERETVLESARPDAGSGVTDAGRDLARLEDQLVALRGRYTEEHPEVRQLQARIARLRSVVEAPGAGLAAQGSTVRARLEIQTEVERLRARRADVERRIGDLQGRVDRSPRTEQELATLTRDYQKLNEHYLALLNKKLDAQMAERLERRWKGEHFRILDPAYLPERPVSPKRMRILLLAMLAGLGAGLGLAFAADFMTDSFRHPADLEAAVGFPLLGSVHHAASSSVWRGRIRRILSRSRGVRTTARGASDGRVARLDRAPRRAGRA
jgi:polysaccharide chain length determinant protein (PEP-CTERM system associated)